MQTPTCADEDAGLTRPDRRMGGSMAAGPMAAGSTAGGSTAGGGDVVEREVGYEADGRQMLGVLVAPADSDHRRPGVLIAHGGAGERQLPRASARRLAELGYVAFAVDYHGGGRQLARRGDQCAPGRAPGRRGSRAGPGAGRPGRARRRPAGRPRSRWRPSATASVARSCWSWRAEVPTWRPWSASTPSCRRRGRPTPSTSRERCLRCIGTADPFVPPEQQQAFQEEMDAAGVDWQLHLYGGVPHAFTDPNASEHGLAGVAYDRRADDRSWQAMLDLFTETVGGGAAGSSG